MRNAAVFFFFFKQKTAYDMLAVTGVQTCALPILGIQISGVSPDAQKLLENHAWPGNVRELENTLIRAAVLSSGPILFPKDFSLQNKPAATTLEVDQLSLEEIIRHKLEDYFRRTEGVDVDNLYSLVIERIERPLIELTLKKTRGNQ